MSADDQQKNNTLVIEYPFGAELAFGKPVQRFRLSAKTLEQLQRITLAQIAWARENLHLELSKGGEK